MKNRLTAKEALYMAEQWDDDLGLNALTSETLQGLCQCLGQSARGNKMQLIERIRGQIRKQYPGVNWDNFKG